MFISLICRKNITAQNIQNSNSFNNTCTWDVHDIDYPMQDESLIVSAMARIWSTCIMFNGQIRTLKGVNVKMCALFGFNTNRLVWKHLEIQCRLKFSFWFTSKQLMYVTTIVVSTANSMVWDSLWVIFGKSLICIFNSKRPRTQPH
jgi:hypothetical protein